jgi:hypothetical protein
MVNPSKTIDQKFFDDRSIVNKDTGCIEWSRATSFIGYGVVKHKQKQWQAHRFSWTFHFGKIPNGKIICHKCDNRKCINPDHLFIGVHKDNSQDMISKGRNVPARGERSGTAKLTNEQIALIKNDTRPQKLIAKTHNICQANVSLIKSGKTWAHVL